MCCFENLRSFTHESNPHLQDVMICHGSPASDTLIGSCGRSIWARDGLCLVSKTPKWAVPDEKVRVWKSSSTQIYPNLRYCWGKTLPPFLTKQTGSGSMRMRFSTSSIVCFSPYPAELTFPSNLN